MARVKTVSYSFSRPADTTAYADNDLVANSTTAGDVVPMRFQLGAGGSFITQIKIIKSDELDVTNASFSISLYTSVPTNTNGDNGAINYDDDLLCTIDVGTMTAQTANASKSLRYGDTGFTQPIATSAATLWGFLEANAAYQGLSGETFTVELTYLNAE